ncbi:MAG: hypothetical protein ABI361_00395 [Nitrososphaera sp.]
MSESGKQTRRELIEWRYNKEIELSSKGLNQNEIAQFLKLDKSTISKDFKHLRRRAKEGIAGYIENVLPLEHEKSIVGLDAVIREAWSFALSDKHDPRIRIQALGVVSDAIMKKQAVLGDPSLISKVLKTVGRLKEQLLHQTTESPSEKSGETSSPGSDEQGNPAVADASGVGH